MWYSFSASTEASAPAVLSLISDLFVLIDVSLMTRGSDPVEATKSESKDTQPVKKVRTCCVNEIPNYSHNNNGTVP